MQLIVDKYGSVIKRKENVFQIVNEDKKKEFSADIVSQIIISSGASISSGVIKLAMEKDIDIVYLNKFGTPYARIYPCKLGGTTLTRRKQATQYCSERIADVVKEIIKAKIKNQIGLLKIVEKTRDNLDISKVINTIKSAAEGIDDLNGTIEDIRNKLLGIEGFASRNYWTALSKVFPFKERQQEAKDAFNSMLNYGYGILYSEVEKACIIAGLDPYLGFMHTDRYGKPSMVLDLIEDFRQPIVDRAITTLFSRKQVDKNDIEESGNTLMLSRSGKRKTVEAVLTRLHSESKYNDKTLSLQVIILEQARQIVRVLLAQDKNFEGYVHKW
jgi:CRISPR-associated protein Cas1